MVLLHCGDHALDCAPLLCVHGGGPSMERLHDASITEYIDAATRRLRPDQYR